MVDSIECSGVEEYTPADVEGHFSGGDDCSRASLSREKYAKGRNREGFWASLGTGYTRPSVGTSIFCLSVFLSNGEARLLGKSAL